MVQRKSQVFALPVLLPSPPVKANAHNKPAGARTQFQQVFVKIQKFDTTQRHTEALQGLRMVKVGDWFFATPVGQDSPMPLLSGRIFYTNHPIAAFEVYDPADHKPETPKCPREWERQLLVQKITTNVSFSMYEALYLLGFMSVTDLRACRGEMKTRLDVQRKIDDREVFIDEVEDGLRRGVVSTKELRSLATSWDKKQKARAELDAASMKASNPEDDGFEPVACA